MKECRVCKRCFYDAVHFCPNDGAATTPSLSGEPLIDGRYQLERRLGQGGIGIVFQARHFFLKTSHAIKVILPDLVGNDPMLVTRFRQEALAAAAIRHQNIIAVTDFGVVGGTMPFLVMEFVNGQSLQDILAEEKVMAPSRALEFACAIGAALDAAHKQNIVHRDLKPSNIMIQDGQPIAEGLKILDFGLAKIKSGELLGSFVQAKTSGMMDSPFYMAPELWAGDEPDARADIYSLGIILYQMLAGDVPFKGASIPSIMSKHLTLPPPSFKSVGIEVPPRLEAVVRHALEKEISARPPTVEVFLAELRETLTAGGLPLSPSQTTGAVTLDEPMYAPAPSMAAPREPSPARVEEIPNPPTASQATAETPIYLDENVQFTVYKPRKMKPQKWYTLLAYAHLSERRAGEDEVDPIEQMEAQVNRVLGEQMVESYSRGTEDSSQAVPRRGEITFVPFIPGVDFNPERRSFLWQESVHEQQFRMLASPTLEGKTVRGQMSVFLGSILLAEINLSVRVDSAETRDEKVLLEKEKPARPYRKVFPSYSHQDSEIVAQIEHYAQISGDKYLRDVYELRSGQDWKRWMREAIEDADIFQLFWSTNSMRSQNVKLEWQHALSLRRPNFIRPTYWESPLPQSPADNLPPPELLDLHFQQVRSPLSASIPPARQVYVSGGGSQTVSPPPRVRAMESPAKRETEARPAPPDYPPPSPRVRSSEPPQPAQTKRVGEKHCSTCGRSYEDEALNFCLEDGTPLTTGRSRLPTTGSLATTRDVVTAMPAAREREMASAPQAAMPPILNPYNLPQGAPMAPKAAFPPFVLLVIVGFIVIGLIAGVLILYLILSN
jgi:serine/threonine-protein kinase